MIKQLPRLSVIFTFVFFLANWFSAKPLNAQTNPDQPNILLIIADDLGIDAMEGFGIEGNLPVTPNLDALRGDGISFTNCWAAPQCSPTRAAIMSGQFGIKTGVMSPPGPLEPEHTSIFTRMKDNGLDYNMAVIGKWHIGGQNNYDHPAEMGVDHFEGFFSSAVEDYYEWTKLTNGQTETVREYTTTHLTNSAINWIGNQNQPWLLWLAHAAPHGPLQAPPADLHTTQGTDARSVYNAMIEAMDFEIGRLLESMDEATRNNTIILFIGDNGTPNNVSEFWPRGHAKGSIYEGGVRVPLIISGNTISRKNIQETALTNATDLHATILELIRLDLPGGINNSLSLEPLLSEEVVDFRTINYMDYSDDGLLVWATRNDRYKLIEDENGNQEFYDINTDIKEENNLINNLTAEQESIRAMLESEANIIRTDWSCNDGIQNGNENEIDDCDATPVSCGIPTGLTVNSTNSARRVQITWDGVTGANQYNLQIREKGSSDWTFDTNIERTSANFRSSFNTYEAQVRTICENGETSAFGAIQEFTLSRNLTNSTARNSMEYTAAKLALPAYEAIIYPNPVNRIINIEHSFGLGDEWRMVNAFGQTIEKRTVNTEHNFQSIDVQVMDSGVYYLVIHKADGNTISRKFIKQ